jgi:hypothetical protein
VVVVDEHGAFALDDHQYGIAALVSSHRHGLPRLEVVDVERYPVSLKRVEPVGLAVQKLLIPGYLRGLHAIHRCNINFYHQMLRSFLTQRHKNQTDI